MESENSKPASLTKRSAIHKYRIILVILAIGYLMGMLVNWQYKQGIDSELKAYQLESSKESDLTVSRVSVKFHEIYNALHTIARLPGIRGIRGINSTNSTQQHVEQTNSMMNRNAQISVQEVFNTLIANVSVNELYIVPIDLDPDGIDPQHIAPREPLYTYKHFHITDYSLEDLTTANTNHEELDEVEEDEIHEYRLLRSQLDWLQTNYPNIDTFAGFNYPLLSGSEVITCEVSNHTSEESSENEQTGFILSVPYYDFDGNLAGCISSVQLTSSIGSELHTGDFAILNTTFNYSATTDLIGQWELSQSDNRDYMPDPNLLFSDMKKIPTRDHLGQWYLWVGHPDSKFWSRTGVKSALRSRFMGLVTIVVLTVGGLISALLLLLAQLRLTQVNAGLEKLATTDILTGLPNRASLLKRLDHVMEQSKRDPTNRFALLFFDLDRFKIVNDSLGHKVGDNLLRAIATQAQKETRKTDLIARFGGDEFVVLLDNLTNYVDAQHKAKRLLDTLSKTFIIDSHTISCPPSIGLVTNEHTYQTTDDMIRDADIAMYQAKQNGGSQIITFNDVIQKESLKHLTLEADLSEAISEKQFRMVYQPIVDLDSRSLVGFEALIRWDHPEHGLINPLDFIPIAEDSGLIVPIGEWVLRTAAAQHAKWNSELSSTRRLKMFINVSKRQLTDSEFLHTLEECKKDFNIFKEEFILEITETSIVEDLESVVPLLETIRKCGFQVAIDDFGTGVSSFSALHKLPVDLLKIDQSFLRTIDEDESLLAIVTSITNLAKKLGIRTVGEGIETSNNADLMKNVGCKFGQGYFFTKPLSVADAESYITECFKHHVSKHAA